MRAMEATENGLPDEDDDSEDGTLLGLLVTSTVYG